MQAAGPLHPQWSATGGLYANVLSKVPCSSTVLSGSMSMCSGSGYGGGI